MNAARFRRDYRVLVQEVTADGLYHLLTPPPGVTSVELAGWMQYDPRIQVVEPNVPVHSSELYAQWITAFDGDRLPRVVLEPPTIPSQVNYGDSAALADGAGVTVAILDTGISTRHPALAERVLPGWSFIEGREETDDAPAGVDSNGNGEPDEAAGHGTAVAGIVARFAPGARLLPVKVLGSDGTGTLWGALQGIRYAVARGARVVNLSFGTLFPSRLLRQAVREADDAGTVVISTAGNRNRRDAQYPAACAGVLAVAALNADNTKARFSNYGRTVDLAAPGVNVVSTFWDGTYVSWSGTSFAAPMVSGEAALILSAAPSLTACQAGDLILSTSNSVDGWNPDYTGQLGRGSGGLIDVYAGVLAAVEGKKAPTRRPKDTSE